MFYVALFPSVPYFFAFFDFLRFCMFYIVFYTNVVRTKYEHAGRSGGECLVCIEILGAPYYL